MKNFKLSRKVENMAPSGIRVFFDLVLGMKDVISLGVGEPDFVTPWHISEAAIFSIEQGFTSYTSNKGLLKLRLLLNNHIKKNIGVDYDPDEQILITVGVSEALDLAMRAIINPGDKVIIPEPCYVSYSPVVSLSGGKPVSIPLSKETNFKITPHILNKYCDKKTKAILLNYPSNPTGVTYTRKELLALKKVMLKHNLIVISDEIYADLTYDFKHTPLISLGGLKDRTVYLNGFSKGHAMTGWRVGYACGPKEIIAAMTKIHQYTMLCAPIMSQMAASEAIQRGEKAVHEMKREYKRRRNFIIDWLNKIGLTCRKPDGAFYAFPSIRNTKYNSLDFANQLLKEQKVAVVPGTAFGKCGEGYIRISYASELEILKEAMDRIEAFVGSLK